MKKKLKKLYLQKKRRSLKKIVGTTERPRLSVFRSHKHIYAQLIDDSKGTTLAASSTLNKEILNEGLSTATQAASLLVGKDLAKKAIEKQISFVVFDRGNRPYHGRIKAVSEGAREAGLIF
jgi:large subunit ribosomal protein L18